jgi:hypothetical protein
LLGGPKRGVRSCQSLVLVVQSRLIDTQQHIFLSRRLRDRGAPTTLIDYDGGHEGMFNHRSKPIQLGTRTVNCHSPRRGNYSMERSLLGLAANMSSNNARAPFTVLLVPSSFVQASPGARKRAFRVMLKQPCPSETSPSPLHHTAALYQCHGAVSSVRDCRGSTRTRNPETR